MSIGLQYGRQSRKEGAKMWISKKKYKALEKRIADLEVQVQSQQNQRLLDKRSNGDTYNLIRENNQIRHMGY